MTAGPDLPDTAAGPAAEAGRIARRFLALMEERDLEAARDLLAPGFVMTFPGTGPMTSFDELLAWGRPRYKFVQKTYAGTDAVLGDGDTAAVYCRGTLSGEWSDGTPFSGIRFIDRFELVGGKISRQDVWNDMAEMKGTR